jgi:tRNA pseudouridine38-40 synthase
LFNKKCIVEYDGTNFFGWQIQKNLRTVQSEIEYALKRIYKTDIRIHGSGRTDTGVHALNQVFHFKSLKYLENDSIYKGLNSLLPDDIVIKKVFDVPENFHAQKSAISKTYVYKILNRKYPSALMRNRYWWIRWHIDVNKFDNLLQCFVGEHDFSCMCVKKSLKHNNVRIINYIKTNKLEDIISVEINANGFLHNMVRNIIGTAKYFYFNKKGKEDIDKLFSAKNVEKAGPTAPPHGLYLKEVIY